jgi:hypothetical protein|tara:strand:+ start:142 stop:651 length:510 start_codon:yes stop_codon:yes gene_type:complete
MTEETNFKSLCNLTTRVLGLPDGSLALKTRRSEIQIPRSVASVIAILEDDIHPLVIAKVINRDRCSVYHYQNRHKDNYANSEIYRNIFNKVYKSYKDLEGAKDFFLDKDFMKNYLLKNGVKEAMNPDVLLEVTSGQVKCIIETSYFDFSNQLENIKFAIKNYHYTVKII